MLCPNYTFPITLFTAYLLVTEGPTKHSNSVKGLAEIATRN
jgi:hypothetical protein